jgi:hypothetical protein
MAFKLCAACSRHVRASSSRCPFCDAAAFRVQTGALVRIARGAIVVGALGCGSKSDLGDIDGGTISIDASMQTDASLPMDAAQRDVCPDRVSVALYGTVPPPCK